MKPLSLAKKKYRSHKYNAERRGIQFLFTFDEWFNMWQDSGKWEERGHGANKYCMARHNDTGPYSIDNVLIQTNKENNQIGATRRDHDKWLTALSKSRKNPEWRAKVSKEGNSQYKSPIKGICKTTGKEIILNGAKEIRNAGFTSQHVYKCVNGKLKSHGGYTWQRI